MSNSTLLQLKPGEMKSVRDEFQLKMKIYDIFYI